MAIVSCKLCGGQVELSGKSTSGNCPRCGVPTTFPVIEDERMEKLFARAEEFRRTKDFDKAVAVYESILDFSGEDPDVYWGLFLARSGVVYEEDPATHERVPVCCREASVPILADPDYLNAQKYADEKAREIYAKEALRIAAVQKVRDGADASPDVSTAPAASVPGPSEQADSLLRQIKERYDIGELVQAPVPLDEEPAFRQALKSASPELRDELLEIQRSQCDYAFRQCMETNRASDEAALSQCAAPLADDPNFKLALQCAGPERREQLLRLQYAQSDRFLHACMRKYHVSDAFMLRRCIVDMMTDPDFSAALKCASPEQEEALRLILAHQRKRRIRRYVTLLILFLCIMTFFGSIAAVYMTYPEVGAVFGVTEKQYELAEKHLTGKRGNRIDYVLAAKWFRKAADQKHAAAQFQLGRLYLAGLGVDKDPAEADKCFRRAFGGLRRAAQKGRAREQNLLGDCYLNGWGIEQDEKKAADWYGKAANAKYAPAQYNLGDCYLNGRGVGKDEKKAVEWFRKAERKDSSARIALGDCYLYGRGVEKDGRKGMMYYLMAAKKGDARAKYSLGLFYETGVGAEQDKVEAADWYRQAAEQGLFDGQLALGRCYENGIGVEANGAEAVKWYRMAATGGSELGQYELARCCENGIGMEKNAEEAVTWFRKAAERGLPEARYELGRCCENGIGMKEKDREEAVKWYRLAAEQSNLSAVGALKRLESSVKENADAPVPAEEGAGQSDSMPE